MSNNIRVLEILLGGEFYSAYDRGSGADMIPSKDELRTIPGFDDGIAIFRYKSLLAGGKSIYLCDLTPREVDNLLNLKLNCFVGGIALQDSNLLPRHMVQTFGVSSYQFDPTFDRMRYFPMARERKN